MQVVLPHLLDLGGRGREQGEKARQLVRGRERARVDRNELHATNDDVEDLAVVVVLTKPASGQRGLHRWTEASSPATRRRTISALSCRISVGLVENSLKPLMRRTAAAVDCNATETSLVARRRRKRQFEDHPTRETILTRRPTRSRTRVAAGPARSWDPRNRRGSRRGRRRPRRV